MAGSISLSLSQQFDPSGKPYGGGKVYFIQAGTVGTPQNAFQDLGLTLPWPNPYTLLDDGRIPQLYFADGYIKVRITDKSGVQIFNQDNIPVTGPSSGGGGGGGVDPTTVMQTGQLVPIYGTGVITGFVRANARTIGSSTSGATERANADTAALFAFLWNADINLAVSGGRGVSASADYAANKTIALPDFRGRAIAGLDDMGNSAAGRLTATYFGTAATVLGASGGSESKIVAQGNFPNVNFNINTGAIATPNVGQFIEANTSSPFQPVVQGGSGVGFFSGAPQVAPNAAVTGTVASGGSGTPLAVASPMMLATIYLKL